MTSWEERVERQREQDLADMQYHWGDAYEITWLRGMFRAERRDTHASVTCAEADELRRLVHEDYRALPVPRDVQVAAFEARTLHATE